jgi:quinol monooxygenase YgiN
MIRLVKLSFQQQYIDTFKQLFEARKEQIRNFNGCSHLELWQDCKNPSLFITYSIWDSPLHLEDYRTSPLFEDTWSTVKPWFHHKPEAFSANKLYPHANQ